MLEQRDRKAREVRPVVLFECRQDVRVRGVDEVIRSDQRDETAVADEVGRGSRDLDEKRLMIGRDLRERLRDVGENSETIVTRFSGGHRRRTYVSIGGARTARSARGRRR